MRSAARSRLGSLLATVVLSGLPVWPGQAGELVVYNPQHRPGADLATLAVGILGPDGTAMLDAGTGKLILRGSSSALEQALEALEELDIPLRHYRVEARRSSREELTQQGFTFSGWLEIGELHLGRVTRDSQKVVFKTLRTEHEEDWVTSLQVLEGHSAEIWTGTSHPLRVDRIFKDDLELQLPRAPGPGPTRRGFRIRPHGLPGGSVELEISSLSQTVGSRGELHERSFASRVRLAPGEDLVIGGVRRQRSGSSHDLFGGSHHSTDAGEGLLWVRISVVEPDPRP